MNTAETLIGTLWEYYPPDKPHCPVLSSIEEEDDQNVLLVDIHGRSDQWIDRGWLHDAYIQWIEPVGASRCPYCGIKHIV